MIQLLVDHIQRRSKAELVGELPPALDQALVAAGLKASIGPLNLSTVVQREVVLSTAHKLKRLTNPCDLPSVRTLLSRARRASVKRCEGPQSMLPTCDESLEGLRDRALLCFGFASLRHSQWRVKDCRAGC